MTTSRICWLLSAFILLCAIGSQYAHGETNLYVGAWSEHLLSGDDKNEQHNLLALEHEDILAGYFRNSYSEDSFVLAYDYKGGYTYKDLTAGIYVGAVYGYRHCLKGWEDQSRRACPMAAPYITWDAGPANPTVFLLGEALAVSIRISL